MNLIRDKQSMNAAVAFVVLAVVLMIASWANLAFWLACLCLVFAAISSFQGLLIAPKSANDNRGRSK